MTERPTHRRGTTLDSFAELVSQEVHPFDAAQRLGFSREYGKKLMRKLRADLGVQAR